MKGNNRVNRTDKLNSEFKRAITEIIARKLKDTRICAMVSVTGVDTSKDLSNCKVYLSIYSTDEQKKKSTFEVLVLDAKKVRYELAQMVMVRKVPEIRFCIDDSLDYGDKMDKLFLSIKGEKGEKDIDDK